MVEVTAMAKSGEIVSVELLKDVRTLWHCGRCRHVLQNDYEISLLIGVARNDSRHRTHCGHSLEWRSSGKWVSPVVKARYSGMAGEAEPLRPCSPRRRVWKRVWNGEGGQERSLTQDPLSSGSACRKRTHSQMSGGMVRWATFLVVILPRMSRGLEVGDLGRYSEGVAACTCI